MIEIVANSAHLHRFIVNLSGLWECYQQTNVGKCEREKERRRKNEQSMILMKSNYLCWNSESKLAHVMLAVAGYACWTHWYNFFFSLFTENIRINSYRPIISFSYIMYCRMLFMQADHLLTYQNMSKLEDWKIASGAANYLDANSIDIIAHTVNTSGKH